MKEFRPVNISNGSFNFCKYTIAGLLWLALLFKSVILVEVCFAILVISYIVKVEKAPLVFFYNQTINKFFPTKNVMINENSISFAHLVGAIFSAVAILVLLYVNSFAGWVLVFILAILKTSGAFGMCGAMKLYDCLSNPNGTCCRVGKKIKKC